MILLRYSSFAGPGLFTLACLLASPAAMGAGFFHRGASPASAPILTPCDLVTCSEAYSLVRAMRVGYTGPLFQLSNGTTTLDVGQVNHIVDLSTWSAFCGGVQSNCKYAKIYAQIQGHVNDLRAATLVTNMTPLGPSGVTCVTADPYVCAAKFQIEVASGYPVATLGIGVSPDLGEYVIGTTDVPITGVNPAGGSMTEWGNMQTLNTGPDGVFTCCGFWGLTHVWNATAGNYNYSDYTTWLAFGTGAYCTANHWCFTADLEQYSASYGLTLKSTGPNINLNFITMLNHDQPTNTMCGTINGKPGLATDGTTPCPLASPVGFPSATWPIAYLHLGGGGDLTQPAPVVWREGLLMNTAMSLTDEARVRNATKQFFNTLVYLDDP